MSSTSSSESWANSSSEVSSRYVMMFLPKVDRGCRGLRRQPEHDEARKEDFLADHWTQADSPHWDLAHHHSRPR